MQPPSRREFLRFTGAAMAAGTLGQRRFADAAPHVRGANDPMTFTEIKFQDPATKTYLGSPSIVRLANGDLLATHDYFGPGCPRNHEREEHLSSVYRSSDDGASWTNVTHIAGAFWSNLLVLRDEVYLLGCSQQYGSLVIRRSEDNGNTWTHPWDETCGLISRGGPFHEPPNYHCAPMPVLAHNGRLYRAFEDNVSVQWPQGFHSLVISAPEDADLLRAGSWALSNKLALDPSWVPQEWGRLDAPGWLEGNVVETPDGRLVNILRFNSDPRVDTACMVDVSEDGTRVSFDPTTGFVPFPGGMTKFSIRRDPQTGLYLTLSNNNTDPTWAAQRNVLSLHASDDLRTWRHVRTLLEDDSGLSWEESLRLTGFQYVDWQLDGDDIIYVVRMACKGAHNYHDANRVTFHRVQGPRSLL